jgi:predicted short-subunit dehydrogenase-like oxidoreductase (DUF2520 family)
VQFGFSIFFTRHLHLCKANSMAIFYPLLPKNAHILTEPTHTELPQQQAITVLCPMNISMLGSGNVATVLARMAHQRGHRVVQVYSRNRLHAEELADLVQAQPINDLALLDANADLLIAAVTDSGVAELAAHLQMPRGVLIHTAGALPMDVLAATGLNYGVLYPLQSLRKEKLDYDPFPLLTQASTPENLALLTDFAESLSPIVKQTTNQERLQLHVAAVIANNFTNHLYALAQQYCTRHKISFDLLKPLIIETAMRTEIYSPLAMQTGPALRGDLATIATHLDQLQGSPQLAQLYEVLSASIANLHSN